MLKFFIAVLLVFPLLGLAGEKVVLNKNNCVVLRGEVTDESVTKAQLELVSLVLNRGMSNYPLYLVLDSPGGSLDAGASFIQFAKTIKNLHTITETNLVI